MGRVPDVTSNREHDDSEIRLFNCFCGKGWKSCSKKMLARCAVVGCSNTTNLQEVLASYHTVLWRDDRPEEKKRTKLVMARFRGSERCKVIAV